jgi:hypothetical protein
VSSNLTVVNSFLKVRQCFELFATPFGSARGDQVPELFYEAFSSAACQFLDMGMVEGVGSGV